MRAFFPNPALPIASGCVVRSESLRLTTHRQGVPGTRATPWPGPRRRGSRNPNQARWQTLAPRPERSIELKEFP